MQWSRDATGLLRTSPEPSLRLRTQLRKEFTFMNPEPHFGGATSQPLATKKTARADEPIQTDASVASSTARAFCGLRNRFLRSGRPARHPSAALASAAQCAIAPGNRLGPEPQRAFALVALVVEQTVERTGSDSPSCSSRQASISRYNRMACTLPASITFQTTASTASKSPGSRWCRRT
jgi:hypothetical protein